MATCVATQEATSVRSGCNSSTLLPSFARPINKANIIESQYVATSTPSRGNYRKPPVPSSDSYTGSNEVVTNSGPPATACSVLTSGSHTQAEQSWPNRRLSSLRRRLSNRSLASTGSQQPTAQSLAPDERYAGISLPPRHARH